MKWMHSYHHRKVAMGMLVAAFLVPTAVYGQTAQEWRDSVEVLSQQIRITPRNTMLRLLKAEGNINLEQWEFAVEEYGQVLKLDPNCLAAFYFRAYAYNQLRQYGLARADYESVLALQPKNFSARLGLAHVMQKMGRKTDTLDQLNTLVQLFPDSADAYAARAAYETELKSYDIALYDWDEAIRRAPMNAGFVVSKTDVLISLYRMKEARATLDAAVKRGVQHAALKEWYEKIPRK